MPEQPCAFHPDRMTGVTCSRCDRPICPDDMIDAPVGIHCPICAGRMREGAVGEAAYRARTRVEQTKVGRRLSARSVTGILMGINIAVAVFTVLPRLALRDGGLTASGVLLNPLPADQWWRVLTSMFLHLSLLHIAFNMYALNLFGPNLEQRYGKIRFLILYLVSGIGGAAATLQLAGFGASAGASGAIFGLFGAWFGFFLWHRKARGAREQLQSLLMLLALNAFIGFAFPGINFYAHGGGLAAGFVITLLYEVGAQKREYFAIEAGGVTVVTAAILWLIATQLI